MGQVIKVTGGRACTPSRFRYLFLLAVISGGSFLILTFSDSNTLFFLNNEPPGLNLHHTDRHPINFDDTFTIKTEGCTIPGLKPFDKSINRFIKRPDANPCPKANISLLMSNNTHIWVQTDNFGHYDLPNDANITCCYTAFYRPPVADVTSTTFDRRVQYESCIEFSTHIQVMDEFVKVTCGHDYNTIYQEFFLFALKKELILHTEDSSDIQNSSEVQKTTTGYNVIVMGIDAISRLNFYRTMPKTLAFLKRKGAIELLGYNKVGDNTFPNLTPMLLGVKDTELKKTCWPHLTSSFDNCPFIWDAYKEAGYYTALGEDSASLGTFNFGKLGFLGTPTDYYIHTFMSEAEMYVGNKKDYNAFLCMGNKHFYKVLLDYIQTLTTILRSSKLFGFFWEVTFSHDYLNYPMLMDSSYEMLLRNLEDSKYLDKTVFILLSDHGIRWGDIRYTKQGRLEERLPFVHILLPKSFKEKYKQAYQNLKLNSRRLTTPFDIHATLADLVNLNELKDERIKSRSNKAYAHDISISLFTPLPKNRTCKIAGIDDHWCTCHNSHKIPSDRTDAQEAAVHLVRHLNLLLRDHPQCARLTLAEVIEVTEMVVTASHENEEDWRDIMVVVRTSPGGGVFEATLRHDNQEWTLAGTVSRLNLYGNQSRCVHHYQLKLYCYCY